MKAIRRSRPSTKPVIPVRAARKPYLLSVGFGIPRISLWYHGYWDVKRHHPLGTASFLCFRAVWSCYRKIALPPPSAPL